MSSSSDYLRTLVVLRLDAYRDERVPLLALYGAITFCNIDYLRTHPATPLLYRSGIVYAREAALDRQAEIVRDIPSLLRDGWGDCDDLACWRAAELVVRHGRRAQPVMIPGGRAARWHVVVRDLETGRMHDPSAKLGMRAPKGDPKHGTRQTMHSATF